MAFVPCQHTYTVYTPLGCDLAQHYPALRYYSLSLLATIHLPDDANQRGYNIATTLRSSWPLVRQWCRGLFRSFTVRQSLVFENEVVLGVASPPFRSLAQVLKVNRRS